MHRTIAVAVGIGVVATVCMALLVPTGAGAAQTPTLDPTAEPTKIEAMCLTIPALQAGVTNGLARDTSALTSARDTLASRRTAMTLAMTGLADAIITHLAALDAGASAGPTGILLQAYQAQYVASVVEWSKARSQAFDTERQLVFGELQQTLLDSLAASACP